MGLDMYLNGEKFFWTDWDHPENNPKEDAFRLKSKTLELGYWRKHPNLHGYIVNTFADGKDECQDIYLSVDDIDNIIEAVKNNKLPVTDGFFFGKSYDEGVPGWTKAEVDAETIEILEKAKAWVSEKEKNTSRDVIYKASW
jgi:hypothetical protein